MGANARGRDRWLSALGFLLFCVAWHLAAVFRDSPLLPSPVETVGRLVVLLGSASYWRDIGSTLYRWLVGFGMGCLIGVPLGLTMGINRVVFSMSAFVFDFLRSLPVTAIFPLFLLVFGIGDASKIAMVFFGTVFVVALSAAYGILHSTPARIRMARAYGAGPWQLARHVYLMEAMPQIVVGMRATITIALIVVIVSEMFIGTEQGIGQKIYDAYQKNVAVELYAALLIVGTLGYVSNTLFGLIEREIQAWAGQ